MNLFHLIHRLRLPALLVAGGLFASVPTVLGATIVASGTGTATGAVGTSFDLINNTSGMLQLDGTFRMQLDTDTVTVSLWTRSGTSLGHVDDSDAPISGWVLLGTQTVTGNGYGNLTSVDLGNSIQWGAGETLGIVYTAYDDDATPNGSTIYDSTSNNGVTVPGVIEYVPVYGLLNSPPFTPTGGGQAFGPTRSFLGEIDYTVIPVPEPTVLPLLGVAALGLMARRRRG